MPAGFPFYSTKQQRLFRSHFGTIYWSGGNRTIFINSIGDRNYMGRKWQNIYSEFPNSPLVPIMQDVLATGDAFYIFS